MATLTKNYQLIKEQSGTLNGYACNVRIYAKYNSQNTSQNTSSVTYQSRLYYGGGYFYTGSTTTKSISGSGASSSSEDAYGTYNGGETVLQTITGTVTHNANGNASVSMSATFYSSPWGYNVTVSGSATLPQIKRQATITNAPNFNDEENPTITYNNPNGDKVSTLQACIANVDGRIIYVPYRDISKTETSYTFELTQEERENLRNATPNSNSLTIRFYIKTILSGTTLYSYSKKTMTIVNGNPIFSNFDFEDINPTTLALTGNNKYNINGYSTIRVKVSTNNKAIAQKSASMVKYQLIIGNTSREISYSDSEEVYIDIQNSNVGEYKLYAIDSRGNSTLVTKLAEKNIEYTPLYINYSSSNVERNEGGIGESVTLTYKGNIWDDSFGSINNSIKLSKYELKKSDEDDTNYVQGSTNITPTISEGILNFSGLVRSNNPDYSFDIQESYIFRITLEDELSSYTLVLSPLPSGIPNISLNKNGVGIMCDYDESLGGLLQIGGEVYGEEIYSTSEVKTNKVWIDNKPIYRKVITGTTSSTTGSTWNYVNLDTPNINEILPMTQIKYGPSENEISIGNVNDSYGFQFRIIYKNKLMYRQYGYKNIPYTLLLEYTKTTD